MTIKQHRALLIAMRKKRRVEREHIDRVHKLVKKQHSLEYRNQELEGMLSAMTPVYTRVRRLEEQRYGRFFNCAMSFNMDAFALAITDRQTDRPYEIDHLVRYVAENMAHKCAASIRDAVAKELGMPGFGKDSL